MSSLTSASTLPEIKAAYADNASYVEDGSAVKARAFITACRLLLLRLPKRAMKGGRASGEEIELEPRLLAEQIGEAKKFLSEANLVAATPKVFSVEYFRD